MQKVRAKLRDIWLSPARFRLLELLEKLNSVIRGWANYFRTGVSKEIFSGLDQWMFIRERPHTLENAPQKGLEVETKTLLQAALIKHLNPIIRGWANYYAIVISKEAYAEQEYLMYQKLRARAKHRHHSKSDKWIANKYWQSIDSDNWVFATKTEGENPMRLLKHTNTPIVRYVKVKGDSSAI